MLYYPARLTAAGALYLGGLLLTLIYLRTAHFATADFRLILAIEFLLALIVAVLIPSWRLFLAAFVTFAAVRLPALMLQSDSHSVLFPFFLGLACGRPVATLLAQRKSASVNPGSRSNNALQPFYNSALLIFIFAAILWIYVQTLRTLVQNYGSLLNLTNLVDRMIAPGVSANYGSHLALSIALALLGPLTWAASEALFRHPEDRLQHSSDALWRRLSAGAAVGLLFGLVVTLLQGRFEWLYSGNADQGQLLGRRPGLLSDTGASAALLPVGIGILLLTLYDALAAKGSGKALAKRAPIVLPGMCVVLYLMATGYLLKYQGRGMLLNMGVALLLFAPLLSKSMLTLKGGRRIALFAILSSAAAVLILVAARTPIGQRFTDQIIAATAALSAGGLTAALQAMDPIRLSLLAASFRMISEAPWFGVGLGGFVPALMRLKAADPALQPENPIGFVPGILAETGIVGLATAAVIMIAYIHWLLRHAASQPMEENGRGAQQPAGIKVVLMPVALLSPLVYGYQIVYPEFCAAFFFPLCAAAMGAAMPVREQVLTAKTQRAGSFKT